MAGACLAGCMERLRQPRPQVTLPLEIPCDRVALRNWRKPSAVQGPPCPRPTWCQRLDANGTHLSHNYEGCSSATSNKLPRETEPMWMRRGGNELLVVGRTIQNHSPEPLPRRPPFHPFLLLCSCLTPCPGPSYLLFPRP